MSPRRSKKKDAPTTRFEPAPLESQAFLEPQLSAFVRIAGKGAGLRKVAERLGVLAIQQPEASQLLIEARQLATRVAILPKPAAG